MCWTTCAVAWVVEADFPSHPLGINSFTVNKLESNAGGFDIFSRAFHTIDGRNDVRDHATKILNDLRRFECLTTCRRDIFDDHNFVARDQDTFKLLGGAILFF